MWQFVVNICRHPEIIRAAINTKVGLLVAEQDSLADGAARLQREPHKIQQECNWVITTTRTGKISTEDMELQPAGLHFQALDLRKKHNEAAAASTAQTQAEALKDWASAYLADINRGMAVLETDPEQMSAEVRAHLYEGLEATRFEAKFAGDTLKSLRWAIFEERRRIVRILVRQVLVVKGEHGEKLIAPQLVLDIPRDFPSLVCDHLAPDYRPWA